MTIETDSNGGVTPLPLWLGYAGLLPQLACLAAIFSDSDTQWAAQAVAFGYGALIFSFLGGLWWGLALGRREAPKWIYAAAVLPSLIALLLWLPWVYGEDWPGPSMIALGGLILASPLIDRAIGQSLVLPNGWMRLRWHLSLGLGLATFVIGMLSVQPVMPV
ncbi:MAG: DUF3429 domain-containing protein [Pseudomonadota bacterium]